MSNTFLTDDIITLEGLSILENMLVAAKHVDRRYEGLFGTHGGSNRSASIRIRKPNLYTVRDGAAFSAQDITDSSVTLTIDQQKGVDVELTSKEMALSLSSFSQQVIRPAISLLANKVDQDVLGHYYEFYNAVGSPTAVPSALSTYLSAGVKLDHNACPRDGQRAVVLGPQMQADIVDALKGLYNQPSKVSSQYSAGEMGKGVAGFNWDMDQNVATHTVGALNGTPLTNAATAQTGSSLITDGWTSGTGTVKKGDVFTIDGVYAVNPVSKQSTGVLQQFTVTADGSDSSGAMTISISPAIVASGASQNVTNGAADNKALTFHGGNSASSGKSAAQGLAWHKSAIALAFAPLDKPQGVDMASTKTDKQLGISLRFVRWYDGDTDKFKARFDVLYGIKVVRPEWGCRIYSSAA